MNLSVTRGWASPYVALCDLQRKRLLADRAHKVNERHLRYINPQAVFIRLVQLLFADRVTKNVQLGVRYPLSDQDEHFENRRKAAGEDRRPYEAICNFGDVVEISEVARIDGVWNGNNNGFIDFAAGSNRFALIVADGYDAADPEKTYEAKKDDKS